MNSSIPIISLINIANKTLTEEDEANEKQEAKGVAILLLTFSLLSVIFSSIICFFYLRYRNLRENFSAKLIFLLALLDILCWANTTITSSYFLNNDSEFENINEGLCYFFGFMWTICELLNFGVTLIISISLYLALFMSIDPALYQKKMFGILIVLTLILSIIPFFLQPIGYGDVDHIKCWIIDDYHVLQLVIFYTPLWIVCFANLILMIMFLRGLHRENYSAIADQYSIKFALFPMILIVCYIVGSIRRIISAFNGENNLVLEYIMYFLMPLQGVFNAIVYGTIDEFVKVRIVAFLKCDFTQMNLLEQEIEQGDENNNFN